MTEVSPPITVTDEECLARYILFSNWIRNSDKTVKPEAFIPYPHPNLSVTRHLNLSEEAVWEIGKRVADTRHKTLYGRADFYAAAAKRLLLKIESAPAHDNPNHANIADWPVEKPAQKIIAQQLAADSIYRSIL